MKTFLAIFIGTTAALERSGWNSLSEPERAERQNAGIRAWHRWVGDHKASITSSGAPLGKTKRISPTGIDDIKNNLAGYTIVMADSHQAAAKLFEQHPHFAIFPGDSVEIMECLPVPSL